MKTFLKRLFFLSAATIAGYGLIVGFKVYREMWRVNRLYSIGADCRVIALGSSDAGCSFVEGGEYGTRVFWNSGSSFLFNAMRLRSIAKVNGNGLKNVKIALIPFNQHYPSWYKDDMRTLRTFRTLLPSIWMFWLELMPEYRIKSLIDVFQNVSQVGGMSESVPAETSPWTDRNEKIRRAYLEGQWQDHYSWLSWSVEERRRVTDRIRFDILQLNKECRELGLTMVLVGTPFTSDYRVGVPDGAIAWMDDIVKLARDNGIMFYDMKECMPDVKFRDNCHLLLSGANEFTSSIYAKLKEDRLL